MPYNKKQHYQDNISAIEVAFHLDKYGFPPKDSKSYQFYLEELSKYSGFGGLKCVMQDSLDPKDWAPYEHDLIPLQRELFDILRKNSSTEAEYNQYLGSVRSSVLSAFYTPPQLTTAISEAIAESGIKVKSMLEPSAGNGAFVESFKPLNISESVAIEKDILTGKILKHLHASDDQTVLVQGFEKLPQKYENYFDLVASNIPFGDFRIFDPKLMDSPERKLAQESVHNYFFVKALDACKDGGLITFVTSQGVANSPRNKLVRQYLMENADLVSAIRLPNNMFTDHAGTEVGTDLIVLQKNSKKKDLSEKEKLFVESTKLQQQISSNAYIEQTNSIVCTKQYFDTDPYGKPAIVYMYENDFSQLKQDIKQNF